MSNDTHYVYLNGQKVYDAHESHEHVSPQWLYGGVFAALLVLTGVTYLVSFADLGVMSLPVAMVVAVVKASLVAAFFMHLAFEDRFYAFIFVTSFALIALFFGIVLFDITSTGEVVEDHQIGAPRENEERRKMDDAPAMGVERSHPSTVDRLRNELGYGNPASNGFISGEEKHDDAEGAHGGH